jgi:hypothetical protein
MLVDQIPPAVGQGFSSSSGAMLPQLPNMKTASDGSIPFTRSNWLLHLIGTEFFPFSGLFSRSGTHSSQRFLIVRCCFGAVYLCFPAAERRVVNDLPAMEIYHLHLLLLGVRAR